VNKLYFLCMMLLPICAPAQHVMPIPEVPTLLHVLKIDTMMSSSAVLFRMPGGVGFARLVAVVDSDLIEGVSNAVRTNYKGTISNIIVEIGSTRGSQSAWNDWIMFKDDYTIEFYVSAPSHGQIRFYLESRDRR
jgi:hypothetical protein